MNTDHKLGSAEAVRDMSRLIYDEVGKIDNHITARTAELSDDHTRSGYLSDDSKLSELRAMRTTLDFIHSKIVRL